MQIVGSRIESELPKIAIKWKRGKENIDWDKPRIFLNLGKKDSGKSALNESISCRYPKIIDLFGSRDDEGLCWCRDSSPIDDILLIHGENVELECSWDTVSIDKLTWGKILDYECVINTNSFYHDQDERFVSIEKIINKLWDNRTWKKPTAVLIREASSFIYSRIRQGIRMKDAKADFITFQREMRHFGFSLPIDTIRWTSIDKEMRDLADYLIIKRVGHQGLPYDIRWLYKFVNPMSLAGLQPKYFLILTEKASVGFGMSELPKFHKEEGIDLIKELGIEIHKGEKLEESTLQSVGDEEHLKIVKLYHSGKSMAEIRGEIKRSKSTIHGHITKHNNTVSNKGVCPRCQKLDSDLSKTLIIRE